MGEASKGSIGGELETQLGLYREELSVQNEELRRTNAALAAAQARLTLLFDAAPTGYAAVDSSGRVLEANPALASLVGRSRGAVLGMPFEALLVARDRPRFRTYQQRLVTGEGATTCEVALAMHPEPLVVRLEGALLPVDVSGPPQVILCVTDETERRRLEGERRALDAKLGEVARLDGLAKMASGLAHDFNNLLTIIHVQLELAAEEIPPESPARASITEGRRASEQARQLARELLGSSAREASPPKLEAWRGTGCVLIVDDEAGVRAALSRILRRMGFTTLEAASGGAALEVLSSTTTPIAAVLLDMTMRGMGGEAALRELRAQNDPRPVILMSGFAPSRFSDSVLSLSQGFLEKPFTSAHVAAVMRELSAAEARS